MKKLLSTLSVKVKLFIPVILLILLLVAAVVMFQGTRNTINVVKNDFATINQTTEKLSSLFTDSQKFILTRRGYDSLDKRYKQTTSELATIPQLAATEQSIKSIHGLLGQVNMLYKRNDQLMLSVSKVFEESLEQSNSYMTDTIAKLISEQQRDSVSTFERQVLVAAQEHTNNNYKIWLIFEKLSKDISYAEPLFTYLSELDAANKDAMEKLQGTPALAKAEAAGKANRELRTLATELVSNQEKANQLDKELNTQINDMLSSFRTQNSNSIDGAFKELSSSMMSVVIMLSIVLLIVIVLTFIFASSIVAPLNILIQRINELGNKGGDLTYRIEMERSDEIGQLAKGINTFISSLHTIFSGVTQSSKQISDNADNSAKISHQTLQAMTHQQDENGKVQDAFHQMQSAIKEIADNASSAANTVNDTVNETEVVNGVIKVMVGNINSVTEDLDSAMHEIESLNRDSQNIGSILETIRGISEQTNLLALNAAIEAARAGEQGRGFAVVADEVRSLAQRTQESTEEINTMISTLQSTASRVADVIRGGNEAVNSTNEQTHQVVSGVNQISDLIAKLSEMNLMIASAVEEQSSVTQDVNQSMIRINDIADNCTSEARSSSQASQAQMTSVKELQTLISQFKV